MSLNISASTGATSARSPPASAAPIASTRRAARSPEAAATRRKLISRAGSSCTRPFISASRSSVAFCASWSVAVTKSSMRPVSRARPASRCSRWLSSSPVTHNTPGFFAASRSARYSSMSSSGANSQFSFAAPVFLSISAIQRPPCRHTVSRRRARPRRFHSIYCLSIHGGRAPRGKHSVPAFRHSLKTHFRSFGWRGVDGRSAKPRLRAHEKRNRPPRQRRTTRRKVPFPRAHSRICRSYIRQGTAPRWPAIHARTKSTNAPSRQRGTTRRKAPVPRAHSRICRSYIRQGITPRRPTVQVHTQSTIAPSRQRRQVRRKAPFPRAHKRFCWSYNRPAQTPQRPAIHARTKSIIVPLRQRRTMLLSETDITLSET